MKEAPSESLLLTAEGGWRQLALVHAVDGAEGAHGAAYTEAVEHLARLDQRFANRTACKFTVCLGQGRKISHPQHNNNTRILISTRFKVSKDTSTELNETEHGEGAHIFSFLFFKRNLTHCFFH